MDLIERQSAIDAIKTSRYLVDAMEKIIRLPSVHPEVIACGSGELNVETGMTRVSNAGMLQAGEIHGGVLRTIPIFGEDTNDE